MYRDMTVAVVVPAYNEEGFVGDVIDDFPGFVDRAYVIDDGSTDGTWDEILTHTERKNAEHDGHYDDLVVPIQHEENRGVGGAIKTGYEHALEEGVDATAVLGGDDQMDPHELEKYLDPIADGVAGYAKGNRFVRSEDWIHMPKFRLLGNVVLSLLTKISSGYWGSMDSQNGYTAISHDALERTEFEGMYEYYGYCNDLLARLNAADVVVADVRRKTEYAYQEGWKSHIDYKEYIPRVSAMLFRTFLWRLYRKYLVRDYDPLAPLYGVGMASMAGGVVGFVNSLVRRDGEDAGSWAVATVLGALAFVYATLRDADDNEENVVVVDPEADAESDEVTQSRSATQSVPAAADGGTVASGDGSDTIADTGGESVADADALPFDAVTDAATDGRDAADLDLDDDAALAAALEDASDADHLADVSLQEVLDAVPDAADAIPDAEDATVENLNPTDGDLGSLDVYDGTDARDEEPSRDDEGADDV
ncbi:glycosyltransferase family 2 protein [Halorubellus sp. JP-L1]|uniref:glycosyltransferase family 2 protein n=1 Tax=Halorubellus sp. JP-L1 TaxID=2715753 RepID=UPI001962D5B5|nr:glycosyltransferase family 2 protein [Halorubellus sp. JP-L1]